MKYALLWLTQMRDRYVAAWKFWTFSEARADASVVLTLLNPLQSRSVRRKRYVVHRCELMSMIGSGRRIWSTKPYRIGLSTYATAYRPDRVLAGRRPANCLVIGAATCNYRGDDGRIQPVWPAYLWADNPWLRSHRSSSVDEQERRPHPAVLLGRTCD